jgi:hypothetical protein
MASDASLRASALSAEHSQLVREHDSTVLQLDLRITQRSRMVMDLNKSAGDSRALIARTRECLQKPVADWW